MATYISSIVTMMPPGRLSVNQLLPNEDDTAARMRLLADGFLKVPVSEIGIVDMTENLIREFLEVSTLASNHIDAVVLCTESLWDVTGERADWKRILPHSHVRDDLIAALLLRSGLHSPEIYSVWMSACSNFTSGLSVACSLVEAGQHEAVLLIFADRAFPASSRIMRNGLSIMGDAAACCLIAQDGEYRVRSVVSATSDQLVQARAAEDPVALGGAFLDACERLANTYRARTQRDLTSASRIVGDNFHSSFYDVAAEGLGVDHVDILAPTKAELGHAFSSDCLFALQALRATGGLQPAEEVVLLNLGPVRFGATVVEVA